MVFTLHLRRGRWQYTRTVSSPSSTVTPISTSLAEMDSKCLGVTFFTEHVPAGGGGGHHVGARLDLVGDDGIGGAPQLLHPVDL